MEYSEEEIKDRLLSIKNEIQQTCKNCNRYKDSVKLVAVSKFHEKAAVLSAISAGQFLFGENRVQEAEQKFSQIDSDKKIELYMIGRLQSNKVKKLLSIPSLTQIESVDRIELLEKIENECSKIGRKIDVLLEILTGEETKAGFSNKESVENALRLFENATLQNVRVRGFMTMAANTNDESQIRDSFRRVRLLRDEMQNKFPNLDLQELSMGMSGDFKIAIEEGATIIRIGTAIFGERQ